MSEQPTSLWAWEEMKPHMPEIERRIVDLLQHLPHGLTADEIAEHLGRSVLAVRPIVSVMKRHKGWLVATGQVRNNISGKRANVWRLTCGLSA